MSLVDASGSAAIVVSTDASGSVGVGVTDPQAQLHLKGSGWRSGSGSVVVSGTVVLGMDSKFTEMVVGDRIAIITSVGPEICFVESVQSDLELKLSSSFEGTVAAGTTFEYQKSIASFANEAGETEFLVSAGGNVGFGSWIADERLTLESLDASTDVVDILFRSSASPEDESGRQNAMRLRSGWHNTESDQEGEQRMSIEGYVSDEWSEVVSFRADGHVGIGTSAPEMALHVVGDELVEGKLMLGSQFEFGVDEEGMLSVSDASGSVAMTISTKSDGAIGVGVEVPQAQFHAAGGPVRTGSGVVGTVEGTSVFGVGTSFLEELHSGDVLHIAGETRVVESVVSDTELVLSSGLSDGIVDGAEFAYQKAIARLTTSEGTTEFVVSSEGQVGLGSHVGEERLTLGSLERSPEVVDVVFRSSSSEDGLSERQNAMRLRSGWHNTESDEEGEQRMSIEGYVSDEWSEVVSFRADGHVGIGTSAPEMALHVVGDELVEGKLVLGSQFEFGVDEEGVLSVTDASGSVAMTISTKSDGAMGVGVEEPQAQFHTAGSLRRAGKGKF